MAEIKTCELCGKESRGCRPGLIEGVKMMLCPDCMRHGEAVPEAPKSAPRAGAAPSFHPRKPPVKDVFVKMDKELVTDWGERIKEGRKKKGLTREQLGFKIGERTVTIAKMENGDLRPSDKVVAKLEKELGITLLEIVREVSSGPTHAGSGMTLGDFIKTE